MSGVVDIPNYSAGPGLGGANPAVTRMPSVTQGDDAIQIEVESRLSGGAHRLWIGILHIARQSERVKNRCFPSGKTNRSRSDLRSELANMR